MEYKDYFKILGVSKNVKDKAINRAYRQFARQYHPDHFPGDRKAQETLKEKIDAYAGLGEPVGRTRLVWRGHNTYQIQQLVDLA